MQSALVGPVTGFSRPLGLRYLGGGYPFGSFLHTCSTFSNRRLGRPRGSQGDLSPPPSNLCGFVRIYSSKTRLSRSSPNFPSSRCKTLGFGLVFYSLECLWFSMVKILLGCYSSWLWNMARSYWLNHEYFQILGQTLILRSRMNPSMHVKFLKWRCF
jgi:hypothetical protein